MESQKYSSKSVLEIQCRIYKYLLCWTLRTKLLWYNRNGYFCQIAWILYYIIAQNNLYKIAKTNSSETTEIMLLITGRWLQARNLWNTLGFCSCSHCILWLCYSWLPSLHTRHQETEIPGGASIHEPQLHVPGGDQPRVHGGQLISGRLQEVWRTAACDVDASWTPGWQVRN